MIKLRLKLFILLILSGFIPYWYHSKFIYPNDLYYAFQISGTMCVIVAAYVFYGWRIPLFRLLANAPNIRGTWRINSGSVHDINDPYRKPIEPKAYVVIRQTDTKIHLCLLWDDKEVDKLVADTPTVAHEEKYAFAGTYTSYPKGTNHGVGAFMDYSKSAPNMFTLRYRTDGGLTGELHAQDRVFAHFHNHDEALSGYSKPVSRLACILFALKYR